MITHYIAIVLTVKRAADEVSSEAKKPRVEVRDILNFCIATCLDASHDVCV